MASKPKIPPMQSPIRHTWKKIFFFFLRCSKCFFKKPKSSQYCRGASVLLHPLVTGFYTLLYIAAPFSTFFCHQKYAQHKEYLSQGLFWWVGVLPNGLELFQLLAARFQLGKSRSPDDQCHKDFKPLNISFRVIERREPNRLALPCQDRGTKLQNEVLSREIHSCSTFNINIEATFKARIWQCKIHTLLKLGIQE